MRHVKAGTLDLTASTMFIKCVEMHAHVGACARELNRTFPFGSGKLNAGSAVETLLRTLHGMHSLWAKKEDLNPADLASYRQLTERFGALWSASGWKVSTWVHWTVRHSVAIADLHHNFYVFSSIPTERRNVEFKLDLKHCFKGYKISKPYACAFGFGRVLDLAGLDAGLQLYLARRRGEKRVMSDHPPYDHDSD